MNRHSFHMIIALPLTEQEAAESMSGPLSITQEMSAERNIETSVGCYVCEKCVHDALLDPVCHGEPIGYDPEGNPISRGLN